MSLFLREPAAGEALGRRIAAWWATNVAPLITRDGLSNGAADKAAAVAGGWLPGFTPRLRWPYRFDGDGAAQRIGALARTELPELFDESARRSGT